MNESRKRKNVTILSTIFVYVFIYFMLIFRLIPNYASIINGLFTLVLAVFAYFVYGFQYCGLNKTRKKVLLEVFVGLAIYFTVIYTVGLASGFMINSYSLRLSSIFKNAALPVFSMVALELFRYMFVNANRDSKESIIYITVALVLLDMALNYSGIQGTLVAVFVYFTVKVLPIIFKNALMTYLTYQVGYHSCVLYVIPITLYKFILPYIPNLGNYLYSVVDVSLPALIYIFTSKVIRDELSERESLWEYIKIYVFIIPIIVVSSIIIALVSGVFSYQLVGINTSDISPKIRRGDAALIYKNVKYESYEEGDILVYKEDNQMVIVRIDKKDVDSDGNVGLYIYDKVTQNTEVEDDYQYQYKLISEDMVVGKYDKFKIMKVAYPTIWFNEFIKGDVHEN